jgi:hypothetical protein
MLIACANYPGCASFSEFAGHASYGYCPSKSLFVWGMRLVLISDAKGVPVGYDLTGPKTGQERECALELAAAHAGSVLFADKGFWGKEYRDCMELSSTFNSSHLNATVLVHGPLARSSRPAYAWSSRACSPTSSARCAWKITSPRHSRGSYNASRNASPRSPSACTSTNSPAAHHEPSPPTTNDKPASSL